MILWFSCSQCIVSPWHEFSGHLVLGMICLRNIHVCVVPHDVLHQLFVRCFVKSHVPRFFPALCLHYFVRHHCHSCPPVSQLPLSTLMEKGTRCCGSRCIRWLVSILIVKFGDLIVDLILKFTIKWGSVDVFRIPGRIFDRKAIDNVYDIICCLFFCSIIMV